MLGRYVWGGRMNKHKEVGYTLVVTETYRLGIKGAKTFEEAHESWSNGEEDKFQYGKWYEDEVEDGGVWYELTGDFKEEE